MNVLWLVLPGALGFLAARFLNVPSKTLASDFDEGAANVAVQQQPRYAYVALTLTLAPWTLLGHALGESEKEGLVTIALIALISCLGVFLLTQALRRYEFSREGVRVRGPIPFRFTWDQLRSVDANGEVLGRMKFKFSWMTIALDSNMDGFRKVVRALEVWPTGEAKKKCDAAVLTLRRWREDP
jgi:hypothetical protein